MQGRGFIRDYKDKAIFKGGACFKELGYDGNTKFQHNRAY